MVATSLNTPVESGVYHYPDMMATRSAETS